MKFFFANMLIKHRLYQIPKILFLGFFKFIKSYADYYIFSSLTRRIIFLNFTALVVLVLGILFLNQFREKLVAERIQSLAEQGKVIARAIAASVQMDSSFVHVSPDELIELKIGESIDSEFNGIENFDFSINPEKISPLLRRLISPTEIRTQIYDREGDLLLDSRHFYSNGQVLQYDLPEPSETSNQWLKLIKNFFVELSKKNDPSYNELEEKDDFFEKNLTKYKELPISFIKENKRGQKIIAVATPIQRFHGMLGILLLSTKLSDIENSIQSEKKAIFRVFGIAIATNVILSILLASTIANPLRRLSAAALKIRRSGLKIREKIPDFKNRQDEIGNLARAVKEMTQALYARIDAIDRFAADVSHEFKNPLTSLRSAVEALPLATTENVRKQLMKIIQHDVQRLNRLITDISNASRVDAELAREDFQKIDLKEFLSNVILFLKKREKDKEVAVHLSVEKTSICYDVMAHDLRLSQVITNIIENAYSFVPAQNGRIDIKLFQSGKYNVISLTDNGTGIRAENTDRIFERFYTDRPEEGSFGHNSGLGLSISKQIIEAHGGTITAKNIKNKTLEIIGACFTIMLPKV